MWENNLMRGTPLYEPPCHTWRARLAWLALLAWLVACLAWLPWLPWLPALTGCPACLGCLDCLVVCLVAWLPGGLSGCLAAYWAWCPLGSWMHLTYSASLAGMTSHLWESVMHIGHLSLCLKEPWLLNSVSCSWRQGFDWRHSYCALLVW